MRPQSVAPQATFTVIFILRVIAGKPDDVAVALEGKYMRGDAI
jgi:hypothetical protein